ncbi:MAG: hypothetical protein J6O18_05960 [Bacilli bacterium]|nr:hypothetical protein [Bacilli bacterium]
MDNYPVPSKSFGQKYDQISNFRRVLICILNHYHLSKEFLNCGEKEYIAYFDILESHGLIVLHDTTRRYETEGYMVSPSKIPEVEELSMQTWKRAVRNLSLVAMTTAITAAINRG